MLTKCTLNRIFIWKRTRKASDLATEIIESIFYFSAFNFVHETFTSTQPTLNVCSPKISHIVKQKMVIKCFCKDYCWFCISWLAGTEMARGHFAFVLFISAALNCEEPLHQGSVLGCT